MANIRRLKDCGLIETYDKKDETIECNYLIRKDFLPFLQHQPQVHAQVKRYKMLMHLLECETNAPGLRPFKEGTRTSVEEVMDFGEFNRKQAERFLYYMGDAVERTDRHPYKHYIPTGFAESLVQGILPSIMDRFVTGKRDQNN